LGQENKNFPPQKNGNRAKSQEKANAPGGKNAKLVKKGVGVKEAKKGMKRWNICQLASIKNSSDGVVPVYSYFGIKENEGSKRIAERGGEPIPGMRGSREDWTWMPL